MNNDDQQRINVTTEAYEGLYEFDYYALKSAKTARDYVFLRKEASLQIIAKWYLKFRLG